MLTLSTFFMEAVMPLLSTTGGPLHTTKLGLFTNNIVPTYQTLLAGLTEPTMTGYAQATVTFAAVFGKPDGSIVLQTELVEFPSPTDNTGQIIYGYFLTDGATPANLLAAELLAAPVNLNNPPVSLVLSAQFAVRPANNNGLYTQVSP
jgi:hypothetical protein